SGETEVAGDLVRVAAGDGRRETVGRDPIAAAAQDRRVGGASFDQVQRAPADGRGQASRDVPIATGDDAFTCVRADGVDLPAPDEATIGIVLDMIIGAAGDGGIDGAILFLVAGPAADGREVGVVFDAIQGAARDGGTVGVRGNSVAGSAGDHRVHGIRFDGVVDAAR